MIIAAAVLFYSNGNITGGAGSTAHGNSTTISSASNSTSGPAPGGAQGQTLIKFVDMGALYHGNATLNITLNSGYYIDGLNLTVVNGASSVETEITNSSNYDYTNYIATVAGLSPYTYYNVSLTGTTSSCSFPDAPSTCLGHVIIVSLSRTVESGANGTVLTPIFNMSQNR